MTALSSAPPGTNLSPRLLTVADLAVLPSELPSGPVLYELDNGRLVLLPAHTDTHGAVECNVAAEMKLQGEWRGLGKARCGGVGVVLWRNPDRVVGADAVFIAAASLSIRHSLEGYLETIPDLVVEVRSKNDTDAEVRRKVNDYLAVGVRVVWVPDPAAQTVTVYRPGQQPQVLTPADALTVDDVIPGFRMPVTDVFAL